MIARRIIRYGLYTLLGLVFLVAVLFGFIQTPPGKSFLAGTASRLASGNGLDIKISEIGGFVPSGLTVGRVELVDAKGTFATVEGVNLSWSPLALTGGFISADTIEAQKISLQRLPELPPAPEATASSGITVPRLDLKRLKLAEIEIGAPVFGQAMQLSFEGSARLVDPAQGLALDFALDRTDLAGRIAGKVNFVPDSRLLDIDVTVDEPQGGLISGLAQIEGRPPVNLTLKGKGSLDDFKADLSFVAGEAVNAQGTASIARDQTGHAIMLDLNGALAGLLPANLHPLFEGSTTLKALLHADETQIVQIDDVKLQAAGLGATLKGSFDTEASAAQLRFTLIGGDAARYAALAPGAQWQDWFVDGSVSGPIAKPAVKAAVTVTMPQAQGYGAEMFSATVEALPQDNGSFALTADGNAKGLEATDPKVGQALGSTLDFIVSGALGSDGKPALTGATIKLAPLAAEFTGRATAAAAQGKLRLDRLDLAAFSPLAGRTLGGQFSAEAELDMTPEMLRVTGKGSSIGIVTGIKAVDGLLNGPAELSGSVERGADGVLVVKDANLAAKNLALAVGGRIDRNEADLKADLTLADMALIDPRLSGKAQATATFSGTLDKLDLVSKLSIASGTAMGKPVEGLEVVVKAADLTGTPAGDLTFGGRVAGKPAKGLVRFAALPQDTYRLDPIDLTVGANQVKGALNAVAGLINGDLTVNAGNLADLSALTLTPMSGSLKGTVNLSGQGGKQAVTVKANGSGLRVAEQAIGKMNIDAKVSDAFGTPGFDGNVDIAGSTAGGVAIERATIEASGTGTDSNIRLAGRVQGTDITTEARVRPQGAATLVDLKSLALAKDGVRATLAGPSKIEIAGSTVAIDNFVLVTGKGRAAVSGKAGPDRLALDVKVTALPLSLAKLGGYQGELNGTLEGTIKVGGSPQAPVGQYDVRIAGLSNPDIVRTGSGPFDITLAGNLRDKRASIDMAIKNPQIQDARVTGTISLAQLALDLKVAGGVQLSLVNPMLAASGNRLAGKAQINAAVTGSASAPNLRGTIRLADARFDDVVNGVTISMINGDIVGDGRALVLQNIKGQTVNGGTVTLSGKVTVDPAAGIPADIGITFDKATLVSSETARLVADGRLQASGALMTRPKISGRVQVRRLDINLPDKMSGAAKPIEVRHVGGAPGKKSGKAKAEAAKATKAASPFIADLDLTLSAPNGIFVRGMGMEAELGGDLSVQGTSAEPRSLGGFEFKRGRFDGFGKRLDFSKGLISFNGSLDPELDFVAETESDGITAKVLISGPASAPKIGFASTPTLPQDEVIARLLFDKSASELTMGQAATLAQTIAQLSGSGPGMLDKMRQSLGVDSLDVGTDNGGEVGLGKRINDRVYLGVKQGAQPNSSKVTIDVDITKNIRAQGATGADGSTEVGIGAEWDY